MIEQLAGVRDRRPRDALRDRGAEQAALVVEEEEGDPPSPRLLHGDVTRVREGGGVRDPCGGADSAPGGEVLRASAQRGVALGPEHLGDCERRDGRDHRECEGQPPTDAEEPGRPHAGISMWSARHIRREFEQIFTFDRVRERAVMAA